MCLLTQHRIGGIGGLAKRLIDLAERAANRVAAFFLDNRHKKNRCRCYSGKVRTFGVCFRRHNVGFAFFDLTLKPERGCDSGGLQPFSFGA